MKKYVKKDLKTQSTKNTHKICALPPGHTQSIKMYDQRNVQKLIWKWQWIGKKVQNMLRKIAKDIE